MGGVQQEVVQECEGISNQWHMRETVSLEVALECVCVRKKWDITVGVSASCGLGLKFGQQEEA